MSVKFWHNSFMDWLEVKLISFTGWFVEKRKQTVTESPPVRIPPTLDEQPTKKVPSKRIHPKKTSSKKTDWVAK